MPVVIIDQAHWNQLEQVQSYVNHKVRYVENARQYGVLDMWEIAYDAGDCKDIALAKRKRLMELGWPPESLRMAIAYTERGEMHAVLTVDVSTMEGRRGTYVLDNRFSHVEPWQVMSRYGYRWVERAGPSQYAWTYIGNPMTLRIAAAAATITTSVALTPMASASITPATIAAAMAASAVSEPTAKPATQAAAAPNAERPATLNLTQSFSAVVAVTPITLTWEQPAPTIYWQAKHSS